MQRNNLTVIPAANPHNQCRNKRDQNEDEGEVNHDRVLAQRDVAPTPHPSVLLLRLLDHEDGERDAQTHQQREHGSYTSVPLSAPTGIDAADSHLRIALLGDGDVAHEVADGVADSEDGEAHDEGLDAHHGAERVHEEDELVGNLLDPHDGHEERHEQQRDEHPLLGQTHERRGQGEQREQRDAAHEEDQPVRHAPQLVRQTVLRLYEDEHGHAHRRRQQVELVVALLHHYRDGQVPQHRDRRLQPVHDLPVPRQLAVVLHLLYASRRTTIATLAQTLEQRPLGEGGLRLGALLLRQRQDVLLLGLLRLLRLFLGLLRLLGLLGLRHFIALQQRRLHVLGARRDVEAACGAEVLGEDGVAVVGVLRVRRARGAHVVDLVQHHLLHHVTHGVHGLRHHLHLGGHRHARRAHQLVHVVYTSPSPRAATLRQQHLLGAVHAGAFLAVTPRRETHHILVHVGGLLAEQDDDLRVSRASRAHQHVDDVDHVEPDHFPYIDLLVEEDDDQVDGGDLRVTRRERTHDVGDDVAEERQRVHTALAHEGDHAGDDRGDEQTRTEVGAHADVGVAVDDSGHEGEHIGTAVTEGQEGNAGNAGRNTHLFHHIRQSHTEVPICRGGQDVNDKHQDQQPAHGQDNLLPADCHAVLEIQVVEKARLVRAAHFLAVVFLLRVTQKRQKDHDVVRTRVVRHFAQKGVVQEQVFVRNGRPAVQLYYRSRGSTETCLKLS